MRMEMNQKNGCTGRGALHTFPTTFTIHVKLFFAARIELCVNRQPASSSSSSLLLRSLSLLPFCCLPFSFGSKNFPIDLSFPPPVQLQLPPSVQLLLLLLLQLLYYCLLLLLLVPRKPEESEKTSLFGNEKK